MMKSFAKFGILALIVCFASQANAMRYMGSTNNGGGGMTTNNNNDVTAQDSRAAACAPATGLRDLEWNNVRARIETGGSMWQDRATSRAAYEIPAGGGVSSIYSGALWMGGLSPDGQLKLAAVTFRADGNDFWPGPLTNDGTAEITESTCTAYDKFFVSERQDAQLHRAYFDCIAAGTEDCEDYSIPSYFNEYPAQGDPSLGQDFYLAPFYDYDGDFLYNPSAGDYPWYDFLKEIDCATRRREDVVPLFGDQTYFWIFNDKGNVHSESQGQPIGMEIRAQAFAFTTNDEINNMTFYNYVLINQGSQTLTETYFGSWVDPDLGSSIDDYVGCDVQRGLGYCYNGDATDESTSSSAGYGSNPPAVGVDFFEGPYQDEDGVANPLTSDINEAVATGGIPYRGLGIGYNDTIIDNERFGMRRFVYYNIGSNPIFGDPDNAPDYYNYMRGIWQNGQTMQYGGNGVSGAGVLDLDAGYMFPGDTDPLNWGTGGVETPGWDEISAGNPAGDRRFIQSAGPFTLKPGDYNNITVGVVWARSGTGDPYASVELLKDADDKAQALFDNCFELVSGPDAPDVTVRELENELILMLSNETTISNNYLETYTEFDAAIPEEIESLGLTFTEEERSYKFEGYMIYQLANADVSTDELGDVTKARLIAQCDIENDIDNIVNYEFDADNNLVIPTLKVNGANQGLTRSFQIKEDAFAQGAKALVNHKTYYFMAIAYGYNNYLQYNTETKSGQSKVFLSSRKAPTGEIPVIAAIPHKVSPEANGTIQNSNYGDGIVLTRIEGKGNSGNDLVLTPETEATLINDYNSSAVSYMPNKGPVKIQVVDPLRVQDADFELRLNGPADLDENDADSLKWEIVNMETGEVIPHYKSFRVASEDVLIDYGISVDWGQYEMPTISVENANALYPELISSSITYDNPDRPWMIGIPDGEGASEINWIRSGAEGVTESGTPEENVFADYNWDTPTGSPSSDPKQIYESVVNGTWAPYCLVSFSQENAGAYLVPVAPTYGLVSATNFNDTDPVVNSILATGTVKPLVRIQNINSIDVVFTPDRTKWTRCAVLEMQANPDLAQGFAAADDYSKARLRKAPSVDKYGRKAGDNGYNDADGTLNGAQPEGMGWFPGYAIDVNTGERLNMAFGEDSWMAGDNGRDMVWNPSSNFFSETGQPLFGGQHWIYVFRNLRYEEDNTDFMPRYDQGEFMYTTMSDDGMSNTDWKKVFASCTWVGSSLVNPQFPLASIEDGIIPNEARVSIRVSKPYERYSPTQSDLDVLDGATNGWRNVYRFSTRGLNPVFNSTETLVDVLDCINVVPNPYYAFSTYETGKLDNRVKITNLPTVCTVTIYDMNGTLVRQFKKGDPLTSLDWDLKNHKNIPIASGTYIIHVDVPGVGEKILKWFGVMRPIDLDNF